MTKSKAQQLAEQWVESENGPTPEEAKRNPDAYAIYTHILTMACSFKATIGHSK